jgi:SAM-dependent methyltransferase
MGKMPTETARRTARSFAYEWQRFGALRPEWQANFRGYLQPHATDWLAGRLVLDVGAGSGRHCYQALAAGARAVALDLGGAIDVARRNLPRDALTVEADLERLPFAENTFDVVLAIGVLHHLDDPQRAFATLVRYVKPGGYIKVYVYWIPERVMHRRMLRVVDVARRGTTRLPHHVLHALSYPIAAVLFFSFILPFRTLRRFDRTRRIADAFPLKAYADYPFGVCVSDQFDRLAAPIEWRFASADIGRWFDDSGLEDVHIIPHHGWVASGRKPGVP